MKTGCFDSQYKGEQTLIFRPQSMSALNISMSSRRSVLWSRIHVVHNPVLYPLQLALLTICPRKGSMRTDTTSSRTSGLSAACSMRFVQCKLFFFYMCALYNTIFILIIHTKTLITNLYDDRKRRRMKFKTDNCPSPNQLSVNNISIHLYHYNIL